MTQRINVTEDYGHPWTRQNGWDLLEATADTESELDKLILEAENKYWNIWIRDNTGQVSVVMYKPSGASKRWDDIPENNGSKATIVWKPK